MIFSFPLIARFTLLALLWLLALLLVLLTPVVPAAAQDQAEFAAGPTLKASATVTGDIVRIGDLIDNAGAVADVPIFHAPDLGQTGSVTVASMVEAVRLHHIIGLESHGLSEVAVTRAARTITAKDVEARILQVLAGKYGLPDSSNLAVVFDNEVRGFLVEASATNEIAVARLAYEPRTTRFDVAFELPGSLVTRRLSLRFTGSLSETFETVVPTPDLAQAQVIKASDLAVERRPKANFTPATLTTIEQGQGLFAKHAFARRPGHPPSRRGQARAGRTRRDRHHRVPGARHHGQHRRQGGRAGRARRHHQRDQCAVQAHDSGHRHRAGSASTPRPRGWRPTPRPILLPRPPPHPEIPITQKAATPSE
ncbi:MAG TPA: hypothetical protein VGI22_19925 [Xanthobacteraceae bacterium]